MGWLRIGSCVMVVGGCVVDGVVAQDEAATCYGSGSVVGAVVGTLIVTVGLLALAFFFYKMYWKNRKGKHLVLMTDAESPHDQYAFDNPCFREATSVKHIGDDKPGSKVDTSKWPGWPPVHTFGKEHKSERLTSMDDSYVNDSRLKAVTLRSHDFTGLGFNICGNMRDGIFVKDVLHRGPAFESGCISTGDRIDSVCISFRNMVFEDALTILSYASPYDVQVQLENDSCSRPSTLMRSKRESSAVKCSDRILHPKFTRSQSVSQLKEVGNENNKKLGHQAGLILEKNRMNHSLNKRQDLGDYPTIKTSPPGSKWKTQKMSPVVGGKGSSRVDGHDRAVESHQTKSPDSQNKLHRFGIKVLPISMNPKMGVQSVSSAKKAGSETASGEEKKEKGAKPKELSRNASPVDEKLSAEEEWDASKENVKAMLAKGFLSLKEKINQNTLGRKRKTEEESRVAEEGGVAGGQGAGCPVPRRRSSVTCGVKAYEQSQQNQMNVPEEVFRAGDVARSNRKSVAEGRKGGEDLEGGWVGEGSRAEEGASESEESSDRESSKDETRRPKRSKGKAPSPPKAGAISKEINEIRREAELLKDERRIFEPETKAPPPKAEVEPEEKPHPIYDSDSDTEPVPTPKDSPATKIELSATQVTVHHSPAGDGNDDDVEPSRKAASLGDLSRLDSDQPLSIVLERAVSLDLTEGTSQCAKKRKAPLPPSEEFPAVFDDRNYRKEPRLEGLTTFQRRLKKSSDFGTLEDALHDDSNPSSPQIELNKPPPHDLSEAHSYNIQEFSSWLAECRRPKPPEDDAPTPSRDNNPKVTATSFVNINSTHCAEEDNRPDDNYNVSFRVNGTDFDAAHTPTSSSSSSENTHFPTATSRTVVVISQPNSLEPAIIDAPPAPPPGPVSAPAPAPSPADPHTHTINGPDHPRDPSLSPQPASPKLPAPPSNTLSSPLSSPLTYVTEIKVSTPEHTSPKPHPDTPSPTSVAERIHAFDILDPPHAPFPKTLTEPSKIPIRTMKSETGQRVLATIQSLAKESSAKTPPQVEYAKRVASLFSDPHRSQTTLDNDEPLQTDVPRLNVSGLYFKPSPPKPFKDHLPPAKVPPVVPPRKVETSLATGSTVTVGLPAPPPESQERNVVTFSSFVGRNKPLTGDPALPALPSKISFNVKRGQGQPEINGRQDGLDTHDANDGF